MMKKIKILLIGARYTGKGQIGRSWGRTDADLPALQPVILYDRISRGMRVVAWVMSYDPEFESIRRCFLKDANAIACTFSIEQGKEWTMERLDDFLDEYIEVAGALPPAALIGVQLDPDAIVDESTRLDKARELAARRGLLEPVMTNHADRDAFNATVSASFEALLDRVLERKNDK